METWVNLLFKYFRQYGSYLALLAFFVILIPWEYKEFWNIWWISLLIIMFCKPINDIFPKLTWIGKILPARRQLGIICGSFIIAHGVGAYMTGHEITPTTFTEPRNYLLWGVLWLWAAIPLLLTSNNFSVKKLKKNWKVLQRLSYFMFIFGALHLYFIKPDENFPVLVIVILWIVLKVMAAKKIVLWKK